jgi:hypothetical protein
MNNPAPGSRIRPIRAFDRGVAPMSDVLRLPTHPHKRARRSVGPSLHDFATILLR